LQRTSLKKFKALWIIWERETDVVESKILKIIERNISTLTGVSNYERNTFMKILNCRTKPVPHLFSQCNKCGMVHPVYKSCKNRMCPVCNGAGTVKWIAKRESELLPTSYFLLTYTIPSELRPLFLSNKKLTYNLLFKAMSQTLMKGVEDNNRAFHGRAGFFAVLHTWDQRLNFHPHLHVVIPSGCLSEDKTQWNPSHTAFLLPVRKLSASFRDKLLFYIRKEDKAGTLTIPHKIEDLKLLLENLKQVPWVVHSQAPGEGNSNPQHMIRYLSRYVNKTAVSDKKISKLENGNVHLNYIDRKKKKSKVEILSEELFMKRLVLHILPKGFKKIRFYGFMANRCRKSMLALCRMLLGIPLSHQVEAEGLDDTAFLYLVATSLLLGNASFLEIF
jgi:hypothetical protein